MVLIDYLKGGLIALSLQQQILFYVMFDRYNNKIAAAEFPLQDRLEMTKVSLLFFEVKLMTVVDLR